VIDVVKVINICKAFWYYPGKDCTIISLARANLSALQSHGTHEQPFFSEMLSFIIL